MMSSRQSERAGAAQQPRFLPAGDEVMSAESALGRLSASE